MAFITVDSLRVRLAGLLKLASSAAQIDASSPWQSILTDSVSEAYQDILTRLRIRGYTKAQIDTWARGELFNVDLGLFWALVKGAGLHAYDDKYIERLDRREELDTVDLLDSSGNVIIPANEESMIGRGDLNTSDDMYVPDYRDGRRGEITLW